MQIQLLAEFDNLENKFNFHTMKTYSIPELRLIHRGEQKLPEINGVNVKSTFDGTSNIYTIDRFTAGNFLRPFPTSEDDIHEIV